MTNPVIVELLQKNEINPIFGNPYLLYFLHYSSLILVNILAYSYIALKAFKTMCYSKMTFDWLPMINPYVWPFSVFHLLTTPYFKFWSTMFPTLKFESSTFDISGIIALEAINSIMYICVKLANFLMVILEQTEKAQTLLR